VPSAATARAAPHPLPADRDMAPPPECPMHQKAATAFKPKTNSSESACPYNPSDASKSGKDAEASVSKLSKYNLLNYMFSDLSQDRAKGQSIALDTEREPSTIPKGSGDGNWEYPSPQQMYNALLRKGYHDTDPDHVTSMVAVHNFLNEGAWNEIRTWEGLFSNGLSDAWKKCQRGEQNIDASVTDAADPKLVRFQGRPKDMTPKAAMVQFMGKIWPSAFKTDPPFDRHDWYVQRKVGDQVKEVRYVIDYYEGPEEPSGEPVFYLDVRPALDSPVLAMERMMRWGGDVWYRASGGPVREETLRSRR